jgi:hypothetical protein
VLNILAKDAAVCGNEAMWTRKIINNKWELHLDFSGWSGLMWPRYSESKPRRCAAIRPSKMDPFWGGYMYLSARFSFETTDGISIKFSVGSLRCTFLSEFMTSSRSFCWMKLKWVSSDFSGTSIRKHSVEFDNVCSLCQLWTWFVFLSNRFHWLVLANSVLTFRIS